MCVCVVSSYYIVRCPDLAMEWRYMHCSWLIVKRVNYLWLPSINVPILNGVIDVDLPNVNCTCIDIVSDA